MASGKTYPWMPDFFIVGAMKSGTTTLHDVLAQHPGIFVPDPEIFFFDIDDFRLHAPFFIHDGRNWRDFDFERDFERNLEWYASFFRRARAGQVIGEDSTTYFASEQAPERIKRLNPDARIVVMLRDPAERTYSAYWHFVRFGRAFFDFERSLQYWPQPFVDQSYYLQHLKRWRLAFPADQIHVVVLERLLEDRARVIRDACNFVGVADQAPAGATERHGKKGRAHRFPALALWRNRLLWRFGDDVWTQHLPRPTSPPPRRPLAVRAALRLHRRVNPEVADIPPMRAETRRFLNRLFERENRGLDELIGVDLARYWYRDPGPAASARR